MTIDLRTFVEDFANCLCLVDAKRPVANSSRSNQNYRPGIGPHNEQQVVDLVCSEMQIMAPNRYSGVLRIGVPYPEIPRQRCDICLGKSPGEQTAIEVKMWRVMGDNGKLNDNMIMHILSPYAQHRSALADCLKLKGSSIAANKAILIYGFEHHEWPLTPIISAFEVLARSLVTLGSRYSASFAGLIHPIHKEGVVFAWGLL